MAAVAPAIVLLGLAVRIYRLDSRSLWLDEILTSQTSHLNSAGDVIAWSQAALNQMPLYYMFTWLLGRWGDTAVLLRLPALIAGALVVPAIYLLGRRLFGWPVGVVAALLAALWPFMVWYSQEARNYSLLMLMTTLQMYFAYRAVAQRRAGDWAGLAVFTILNLYCHYLALVATIAAAIYVGGFLLADAARAHRLVRLGIGPALIVAAALTFVVPWRMALRWLHGPAAMLASHRLWLLAAGVLLLLVLAAGAAFLRRRSPSLLLPFGTAVVVAAAYAPWIPTLRTLASRPDQTLGQIHLTHAPSLGDAGALLASLSISGLLLVALMVGLISLGVDSFRTRSAASLLPLAWIGVPVLVFGYLSRQAVVDIDPRYFSIVVPGVVLAAAAGIVTAARIAQRLWHRTTARYAPRLTRFPAAAAVIVALVLAQAASGLANSYDLKKNDYRAVAQHIMAGSPPDSVVLAVGNYSDWTVTCLDYYFRQLRSTVTVVDGLQVDSAVIEKLSHNGAVWGVVIFPSTGQLSLMSGSGAIREDFVDSTHELHVVRPVDQSLSATDQASTLLRWESPIEPQLDASSKLLDLQAGRAARGPNVLPPPSPAAWRLAPGSSIENDSLVLTGSSKAAEINAATTVFAVAAKSYVLSFTHSGEPGMATLLVYAVVHDPFGRELATFPSGAGFAMPATPATSSYFAFTAPAGAWTVDVLLRLRGEGRAEFRDVQLAELSSA